MLTNHHVVGQADRITVTLASGAQLPARRLGADPQVDLALLQLDPEALKGLPPLKALAYGDSRSLRVGDFVVAIGNPFGIGQTVTSGIVSALGRSGLGIEGYEDFIQTDASINPGNSGGALIDLAGRLKHNPCHGTRANTGGQRRCDKIRGCCCTAAKSRSAGRGLKPIAYAAAQG